MNHDKDLDFFKSYKIDCRHCCGLCCTALCFVKTEGFPENKPAGKPCVQLAENFTCKIHADLGKLKMRGCIGYDCFGAGNFVTQSLYHGETWRTQPGHATEIFDVFQVVFSLFQVRYYLEWVQLIPSAVDLWPTAEALIAENHTLCQQSPNTLATQEIRAYRDCANAVLKEACRRAVKERASGLPQAAEQMLGRSFKNQDLSGLDLSMRLLIGADFNGCRFDGTVMLGADTRDADFSSADLRKALFLTQGQVNAAKCNRKTQLPSHLELPPVTV